MLSLLLSMLSTDIVVDEPPRRMILELARNGGTEALERDMYEEDGTSSAGKT